MFQTQELREIIASTILSVRGRGRWGRRGRGRGGRGRARGNRGGEVTNIYHNYKCMTLHYITDNIIDNIY